MLRNKYLLISLVLVVVLSGCATDFGNGPATNLPDGIQSVMLDPESPEALAYDFDGDGHERVEIYIENPSLIQGVSSAVLSAIDSQVKACPLYDNPSMKKLVEYYDLPEDTVVRICSDSEKIQMGTIAVASVAVLPAALEPTIVGELGVGGVMVGGRVVAWIFVSTSATVAISSVILGDVVGDALFPSPATASPLEGLTQVPPEVIDHLLSNTHALEHAVARCVAELGRRVTPNRVYYSAQAPEKKVFEPSVAFVWYGRKGIDELGGNMGECTGIADQLTQEYGKTVDRGLVNLVLVVGYKKNEGFFSYSAYPVIAELFPIHMCDWGYKLQIFPNVKVNPFRCVN